MAYTKRGNAMIQFGLFLLDRGRIDAEQLVSALRVQLRNRLPLGQLAIGRKYLTVKQVFQILAEQTDTQELFGETAIRLGYISRAQLAELLMEQADSYPSISYVLIEQEILTPRVVKQELEAYRNTMVRQNTGFEEDSFNQRRPAPVLAEG